MRAIARQISTLLLARLSAATPPENPSLTELEQHRQEIDGQLARLANYNLGGGIGAIGFRSRAYETANQTEWIEVELVDAVRRAGQRSRSGRAPRAIPATGRTAGFELRGVKWPPRRDSHPHCPLERRVSWTR